MRTEEKQKVFADVKQVKYSSIPDSAPFWVSWRDEKNPEELIILGFKERSNPICFAAYGLEGALPISAYIEEISRVLYDMQVNPENPAFLSFREAMLWLILAQKKEKEELQ
ncbi:hypothetical protein DRH29_03290 [candidate division Kazan bacterium]|uniref:Uncharacterized protein n=1 Tax=candidate division Kazan bacterium TaxID=2202143 RepID=A0A420ZC92_UNCK3|nr:MAG: hypothetical protein DRH29_03290 [candidate division Kazan bacterium]